MKNMKIDSIVFRQRINEVIITNMF